MNNSGIAPLVKLNNETFIPQVGLGTFELDDKTCERVVCEALEAGYRHIDTATVYQNESAVGRSIASSGIPREEIFVTTKLWNFDYRPKQIPESLQKSLDLLGLDCIDLYLIHWPAPQANEYLENWLELEKLYDNQLMKSIGVSNFNINHLKNILKSSSVVPVVNQVELHPAFQQRDLRIFQEPLSILTQAWGPLGQGKYNLAEIPGLLEIAKKYDKTLAQIVLRWQTQQGIIVLPKTTKQSRLVENINIFDFSLSSKEMNMISSINIEHRLGPDPDQFN